MPHHRLIFATKEQGDAFLRDYELGAYSLLRTVLGKQIGVEGEYLLTFQTARPMNKEQRRRYGLHIGRLSGIVEMSWNVDESNVTSGQ